MKGSVVEEKSGRGLTSGAGVSLANGSPQSCCAINIDWMITIYIVSNPNFACKIIVLMKTTPGDDHAVECFQQSPSFTPTTVRPSQLPKPPWKVNKLKKRLINARQLKTVPE